MLQPVGMHAAEFCAVLCSVLSRERMLSLIRLFQVIRLGGRRGPPHLGSGGGAGAAPRPVVILGCGSTKCQPLACVYLA